MEAHAPSCPFLIPAQVDWMWLYPTGAYCRRPGERVKIPAGATLAAVCTTDSHVDCVGYRAATEAPEARATDVAATP